MDPSSPFRVRFPNNFMLVLLTCLLVEVVQNHPGVKTSEVKSWTSRKGRGHSTQPGSQGCTHAM